MKKIFIILALVGCKQKEVHIESDPPKVVEPKPLVVTDMVTEKNVTVDIHEVTVLQYEGCVNFGLCQPLTSEACESNKRLDQPISCVNFEEAKRYCQSVGKRLPTISEIKTIATKKNKKLNCSSVNPTAGGDEGSCDVKAELGLSGLVDNVSEWVTDDDVPGIWGGSWQSMSIEELTNFERTIPINRQPQLGFRCAKDR